MKAVRVVAVCLFIAVGSLLSQEPFEVSLSLDETQSEFIVSLTNISDKTQVIGKGGPMSDMNNIMLVIVPAGEDSLFFRPEILNSANGTRVLPPDASEAFLIDATTSEFPTSGEYTVQAIYESIFQKHNGIPENSPLRAAHQHNVESNTLIVN